LVFVGEHCYPRIFLLGAKTQSQIKSKKDIPIDRDGDDGGDVGVRWKGMG